MKKTRPKYSIMNNVMYLFREIAKTYPFLFALILIEMVLSVVSPVISIYFPSLAVTLVTEQANLQMLLLKLGGLGLLMAVSMGLNQMAVGGKYMMANEMRTHFLRKLFFHSLHCDYIHVESKEGQTKYQRAKSSLLCGDASGSTRMLMSVIALVTNILCFAIYSGILSSLQPLIVIVLILMSLLNLFLMKLAQNYEYSQQDKWAGLEKKMDYVEWTARDVSYGKDIRLYNMKDWFLNMRDTLTRESGKLRNKISKRYFFVSCANNLMLFLRDGIAYGYLIYSVFHGKISIDEFVLYFGAITGFAQFVRNLTGNLNQIQHANLQMNDVRAFLDTTKEPDPENPVDSPVLDNLSIDFDHVWFYYDREGEPVLKDFCLHVNAGEKIALVGINGAGKTTLIKLLCGLYQPDKGEIRIGGVDIRKYRKDDLFRLIAAVFQDIYIAPHTVAENISMTPEENTDMERVKECLEKVGLWDIFQTYPEGIHSYMTKAVHDGILLSGGQQQKLLMARALYKGASLMILDEPTAALDPIAESETYESFHRLTAQQTVIYISHRLASTRFCDRIVFLKNGKVTETGSHNELMKQSGDYAEMFEVQSHYYQKGGESNESA